MTKRLSSASAKSCIQANASSAAASSTISVARSNSDAGAMPVSPAPAPPPAAMPATWVPWVEYPYTLDVSLPKSWISHGSSDATP